MPERVITIDTPAASHTATDDYAARAYCTDECGWSGDWHHADDYPAGDWESDPSAADDLAYAAAQSDGVDHLLDTADRT